MDFLTIDIALVLSCLALLVGPLVFFLFSKSKNAQRVIDGFVFVSIFGLLLIHFIDEFSGFTGLWRLVFLLLGFLGPLFLEQYFVSVRKEVHIATLIAGGIGFLVHVGLDAVALASAESSLALGLAIAIHRIPVGLTIWWLLSPRFGIWSAFSGIALTILITLAGYFLTDNSVLVSLQGEGLGWLQAFVAGSILHVVFFRFHLHGEDEEHGCCSHSHSDPHNEHKSEEEVNFFNLSYEGVGNLLGAIVLFIAVYFSETTNVHHLHDSVLSHGHESEFFHYFLLFSLESAPALLIAYVLGIFIYGFFPQNSIAWLAKGGGVVQALKGMCIGLPLPVCSCGVLPYYKTLIKRGAPPTAAVAFLVATPELGIDAILISLPLLGGSFTLIRLCVSAIIAFAIGYIMSFFFSKKPTLPVAQELQSSSFSEKFSQGLKFSFIELVDTTAPWMLLGIVLGALATPIMSEMSWGVSPFMQVILFSCLGLVVYVCASGATPLVAALVAGGVSPGAGLAFLITGPATNVSTFGVLSEIHGRGIAIRFASLMFLFALLSGVFVNYFFGDLVVPWTAQADALHHEEVSIWKWACLVGIGLLFLQSVLRRGAREFFSHLTNG